MNTPNMLIDGPSRSGKLLLGKLVMASPSMAFQHYSGDLERILESIYFANDKRTERTLHELLRINLVHTFNDLRELRQLSVNSNDSSFFKKTFFYETFKDLIASGEASSLIKSSRMGYVMHTHESILFIQKVNGNKVKQDIINHHFSSIAYIIRNPSAQALSWYSRGYVQDWKQDNENNSPFILYKLNYNIPCLIQDGVFSAPWFVNSSIDYYLKSDCISTNDLEKLSPLDVITLSVCYLTACYLKLYYSFKENTATANQKHNSSFFVFHENLHDKGVDQIQAIFELAGLQLDTDKLNLSARNELSPTRFGRESINKATKTLQESVFLPSVLDILKDTHRSYEYALG